MNEQPKSDCFCHGAGPRLTEKAREFRAKTSAQHFRNAGIEFLRGVRTVVDLGIERLSHDTQTRGTTVNVE